MICEGCWNADLHCGFGKISTFPLILILAAHAYL